MTAHHFAAAFAGLVLLAACGPTEDVSDAPRTPGVEAFGLSQSGPARWAAMERRGDAYVFTDYVVQGAETELRAASVVLEGPASIGDAPALDRLLIEGGQFSTPEGEGAFDRLELAGPGPELAAAALALLRGDPPVDRGTLSRQTFDALALSGLSWVGEDGSGAQTSLAVESLDAAGFDGEVLGEAQVSGFEVLTTNADGSARVRIGSVAATGLNAALVEAAADRPGGDPFGASFATEIPWDLVEIGGLAVEAGAVRARMDAFTARSERTRQGELVNTALMPRLVVAPLDGAPQAEGFTRALAQLGFEELVFRLEAETVYSEAEDRLYTRGANALTLEDGFALSLDQDLTGVAAHAQAHAQWLEAQAALPKPAPAGATPPAEIFAPLMIERLAVTLEDRSIVDRALGLLADAQGSTPEQVRAQAALFVAMGTAGAGESIPPALRQGLASALVDFIGEGGTLIIEIDPETPVSAASLMGSGSSPVDPVAAGVSVRHEPRPR